MPVSIKVNGVFNSLVHKGSGGISIATIPDVCKTPAPGGPVPIPYPNISMATMLTKGSTTVKADGGMMIATKGSEFSMSNGDNAGVAGGVVSSTFMKESTWILYSFDVKIDGANACRFTDKKFHNHQNTVNLAGVLQAPTVMLPDVAIAARVEPGKLKVKILNNCDDKAIEGAEVTVGGKTQKTSASGETTFADLPATVHGASVVKHFEDADHVTFVVHYPRVLIEHEAIVRSAGFSDVPAGGEAQLEIKLPVYRLIPDMIFHRRHIDFGGDDKYGHWWSVLAPANSYGWWPKYPMGHPKNQRNTPPVEPAPLPPNASRMAQVQHMFAAMAYEVQAKLFSIRESGPVQTLRGVEGELNGQTSFGGTATRDPHELGGDSGNEQYQAVVNDCRSDSDIRDPMVKFAQGYTGGWSWRFELGNHCHTFQKALMGAGTLRLFKKLK
jgi:hypothetical protein